MAAFTTNGCDTLRYAIVDVSIPFLVVFEPTTKNSSYFFEIIPFFQKSKSGITELAGRQVSFLSSKM